MNPDSASESIESFKRWLAVRLWIALILILVIPIAASIYASIVVLNARIDHLETLIRQSKCECKPDGGISNSNVNHIDSREDRAVKDLAAQILKKQGKID
jgi:hypothetical protein